MAHINKFGVLLLDEGDKFIVQKGMDMYCYLPIMYFDKEHPFSLLEDWFPITVGNTYKRIINKDEIAKNISKAFYNQLTPSHVKITEFINSVISSKAVDISTKTLTTHHLVGEYTVKSTIYDATDKTNFYYKVYCTNAKNADIKIMFYQTVSSSPSAKFATYNDLEII